MLGCVAIAPAAAQPRMPDARVITGQSTAGQDQARPGMRVYGATRAPFGYVQFCSEHAADCRATSGRINKVALDKAHWDELLQVNQSVNETVKPVEDIALYKTVEYWTYPDGRGDCEDYVLLKRKMLVDRGWPENALLITVVRDEYNLGHAVLSVVTDAGDFILDNKRSAVLRWQETPYIFRKRQSQTNPTEWVALSPNEELRGSMMEQVSTQ